MEIIKKRYLVWLLSFESSLENETEEERTKRILNSEVPEINVKIPFDRIEASIHQNDEW